tara:strand:+ start:30341 stop:30475 length:135 start_codon:yes stop_codon:yes gene_type:complete
VKFTELLLLKIGDSDNIISPILSFYFIVTFSFNPSNYFEVKNDL